MRTTYIRNGIIWSASALEILSARGSVAALPGVAALAGVVALPGVAALPSVEYPGRCNDMTLDSHKYTRLPTCLYQRFNH
jgi:hypothetical protein